MVSSFLRSVYKIKRGCSTNYRATFDLIISIIALLIFFGFTAYDIQKVKILSNAGIDGDVVAINGAFELYLDFINIFLHLISIIGDAKD